MARLFLETDPNKAGFRESLFRFNFQDVAPTAREWWDAQRGQLLIQLLNKPPGEALAVLRFLSHTQLIDGHATDLADEVMTQLSESVIVDISEQVAEMTDAGRVQNRVIRIELENGEYIELVISPTMGVNWRVSPQNSLAQEKPELAIAVNSDESQRPLGNEQQSVYDYFLNPASLAQATEAHLMNEFEISSTYLAKELKKLLEYFLNQGINWKKSSTQLGGSGILATDQQVSTLALECNPTPKSTIAIQLNLGKNRGAKTVRVECFASPEEIENSEILGIAHRLSQAIDSFYKTI